MNTHKNARLTPPGRQRMIARVLSDGESVAAVARGAPLHARWMRLGVDEPMSLDFSPE